MSFNKSKCMVMHLGKKNMKVDYVMDNHPLKKVSEEKDLGVFITDNLKSARQCQEAYSKASRALGMIACTISYKTKEVLLKLYKSLVRQHPEYCVSAWSPHYVKDKMLIERIQHRFSKMVPGLNNLPYEARIGGLGLWTLEECWNRADLLSMFKMYKGLLPMPFNQFFKISTNSTTRSHSAKIRKLSANWTFDVFFFSERVINRWNQLDQEAVDSGTVNSFKNNLKRIRKSKIGFFMDHPVR